MHRAQGLLESEANWEVDGGRTSSGCGLRRRRGARRKTKEQSALGKEVVLREGRESGLGGELWDGGTVGWTVGRGMADGGRQR